MSIIGLVLMPVFAQSRKAAPLKGLKHVSRPRLTPGLVPKLSAETDSLEPKLLDPVRGEPDAALLEKSFQKVKGNFDANEFQLEGSMSQEIELDEAADDKFDSDIVPADELPESISEDELNKILQSDSSNALRTQLAELNPYVAYNAEQSLASWKCCPRRQGYGCKHYNRRLPCFYDYSSRPPTKCCPVYPSYAIQTAYCNCNKCAVLTPYCASVGRCLRRYKWRRFLAVCRRPRDPYWQAKWFHRKVATSCYCKAHC